ncbi:RNA polymerase sigma factor [Agromyces sp. NPDC127015]|uniref:RNA polymerase sigma factor n=1 Tax=Agromyces sp. NPDC127015 TaxID=3347108 RepID=UPI00364963C6
MSTDSELIQRSRDQPAVFGELFTRHSRAIFRYAASRVGPEKAEDVLSNTFLAAFERRRRFDQAYESALPWLLGFASMAIRQHRRDEARHWAGYLYPVAAESLAVVRDDAAVFAAELALVAEAVRHLAPRDRDALLLHVSAGLGYADVGRALGIPIGTVRSRINRARAQLREATGRTTGEKEEQTNGRVQHAPVTEY